MTKGATTGTFAPIPNDVLRRTDLSHGAKLVCARLIQYAGKGNKAFPKLPKLAEEVGMSARAVQRFLSELEDLELIESQRRGRGQSNSYTLNAALLIHRRHFDTPKVSRLDTPKLSSLDKPKVAYPYGRRNNFKKEIEEITAGIVDKWRVR